MSTSLAVATRARGYRQKRKFIFDDQFLLPFAAGSVQGTPILPGPGMRAVFETVARASISAGVLSFATAAANDPKLNYPINRVIRGQMLFLQFTPASTNLVIGFGAGSSVPNVSNIFQFNASGVISLLLAGSAAMGSYSSGVTYTALIVSRMPGNFWFIKPSTTNQWIMLGHSVSFATAGQALYPGFGARGSTTFSGVRFAQTNRRWLPTPVISNGFSVLAKSDGLGHQEGKSFGIGEGGYGVSFTQNVGTWGITSDIIYATALSGGRAIALMQSGKIDLIISVQFSFSSGTQSIIVRWVDENNFIQLRRTSTNLQLTKVVAGVETIIQNSVVAVANGFCMLVVEGTKFRCVYDYALIGSEQTISDAVLQTGTLVGLRTDNIANGFDDLLVYARGTSNEYAVLDTYL